ncbi:hypothetical protein [Salipaludibacillus sp. CF4.18]
MGKPTTGLSATSKRSDGRLAENPAGRCYPAAKKRQLNRLIGRFC